jgi:predicted acyl esterase
LILAAAGAAWSGLPSAASADGTLAVPPSQTYSAPSLSSYLHDVSPVDPRIGPGNGSELTEHYQVAAADGTILDTWIVRPNFPGKRGLVMEFTPYYGGGSPSLPSDETWLDGTEVELLHRGFAVGISSMRGTGNSGGCFSMAGPDEVKDTAAVRRSGSTPRLR